MQFICSERHFFFCIIYESICDIREENYKAKPNIGKNKLVSFVVVFVANCSLCIIFIYRKVGLFMQFAFLMAGGRIQNQYCTLQG
jgi:hypothetical protein